MSKKTTTETDEFVDQFRSDIATRNLEAISYSVMDATMAAWSRYIRDARPDLQGKKNRKRERLERGTFLDDLCTSLMQAA